MHDSERHQVAVLVRVDQSADAIAPLAPGDNHPLAKEARQAIAPFEPFTLAKHKACAATRTHGPVGPNPSAPVACEAKVHLLCTALYAGASDQALDVSLFRSCVVLYGKLMSDHTTGIARVQAEAVVIFRMALSIEAPERKGLQLRERC
jgi:hypothetical protein